MVGGLVFGGAVVAEPTVQPPVVVPVATDSTIYNFSLRWNIAAPDQPGSKTLNVAENVRAVPPGGPGYQRCYGWRQTIENDNNQSDLRKFQARGRAKAAENALINEIGLAMVVNGVALQQAEPGASPARFTRERYEPTTQGTTSTTAQGGTIGNSPHPCRAASTVR